MLYELAFFDLYQVPTASQGIPAKFLMEKMFLFEILN